MTLLAEPMPHVRSAAFYFMVPCGCAFDPPEYRGMGSAVADLITRGAGNRDSRQLSEALDALGLDRSESVGNFHLQLSGVTLSRNVAACLEIYADIIRRHHLPESELDPVKSLMMHDIQGLEDEPQSRVMVELYKRYYPDPLGRDRRGTVEGIEALTIDAVRDHVKQRFQPNGVILSVAGDINWPRLKDQVEQLFGDWPAGPVPSFTIQPHTPQSEHLTQDLDQTQIAMLCPSVPIGHPQFYAARGAVGVLSLGMSSRLFIEIREKHGLCYAIWASYETFRDRGSLIAFTAGRPEKAQELLDRTLYELRRLPEGVDEGEVARVRAGLKSALIMRQESTAARAGSIASDWHLLGRVRPLSEIQAAIDALTPHQILEYLHDHPPRDFTIVTLGPAALKI
jgi:predicted Zn-dependent peptidase